MAVATQQGNPGGGKAQERISAIQRLLTPKEAAQILRVSVSFLAKARMTGNGPAFIKVGRSIRYAEATFLQWMKINQRKLYQRVVEEYCNLHPSIYTNIISSIHAIRWIRINI